MLFIWKIKIKFYINDTFFSQKVKNKKAVSQMETTLMYLKLIFMKLEDLIFFLQEDGSEDGILPDHHIRYS